MRNPVVITGIGLVTPLRPFDGLQAFWEALCSGEDAIKRAPAPLLDTKKNWLMAGIDLSLRPPKDADPGNKLFVIAEAALSMALHNAGLRNATRPAPLTYSSLLNVGLVTGTVLGNVLLKESRLMDTGKGNPGDDNMESLSSLRSYLASKFELSGAGFTVSTACASGTDAVGIAARMIAAGKCDVMVAGGADVLSDFALLGFSVLQALTDDKVRPFDRKRTGLALGEGAAFVVLESLSHASARGAGIYGSVLGYASRADANHLTGPHREGRGLSEAMTAAISDAGLASADVGYINAHGTGTGYNDLMETKAIKNVFRKGAYEIPVSSTKSMLGHSFGAAGVIEAVCCLLAVRDGIIPPTINFTEKDPECDLDYVPNEARNHEIRTAMSLSAGFGGQNAALIVGKG